MSAKELPEGWSVFQDDDDDWCLSPPEDVTIVSVPGEPYILCSTTRAEAIERSLHLIKSWGL